jgi:hypothetical protein
MRARSGFFHRARHVARYRSNWPRSCLGKVRAGYREGKDNDGFEFDLFGKYFTNGVGFLLRGFPVEKVIKLKNLKNFMPAFGHR